MKASKKYKKNHGIAMLNKRWGHYVKNYKNRISFERYIEIFG